MRHITPRGDAVPRYLKAPLGSTQHHRYAGQSVLDGIRLVVAYLNAGHIPAQCLVPERHIRRPKVAAVFDRVDPDTVVLLADNLFGQFTTAVNGVDLMVLVETPEGRLPQIIDADYVTPNGIQDAGNVSSILRCVTVAGVRDVFMMPGCVPAWSARTLRAAMGVYFHLNIAEHCTFENVHSCLQVPLLAMSSHAKQAVFDVSFNASVSWVLGNKNTGVSGEWSFAVAAPVTISQPGDMESLSVAAAAAVCLFEAVRQRRAG